MYRGSLVKWPERRDPQQMYMDSTVHLRIRPFLSSLPNLSTRASRHAHQTLDNPSPLKDHSDPTPSVSFYTLVGAACNWMLVQTEYLFCMPIPILFFFSSSPSPLSFLLFFLSFLLCISFSSPSLEGRIRCLSATT
ncbi:hypothetical protein F4810DRAFT_555030 [Camillea tinctor]|nr:hypothetical protein F4810DRAFT_555030 [Camillea tinctor]